MGWGVRTEDNRAPSWQGSWVAQPSPGRPPPAVRPLARVPVVRAPPGSPPLWSSPRHEWASPLLQSLLLDPPSLCTCAGPAVFVHVCIQCRHPCSPSPPPCGQATLSSGLPPGGPSLLTHSPGQVPGRPRPTGVLPSPPCTDSLPRGHAADPALWLPCPPHPPHSPCSPYLTILGKILPPPPPRVLRGRSVLCCWGRASTHGFFCLTCVVMWELSGKEAPLCPSREGGLALLCSELIRCRTRSEQGTLGWKGLRAGHLNPCFMERKQRPRNGDGAVPSRAGPTSQGSGSQSRGAWMSVGGSNQVPQTGGLQTTDIDCLTQLLPSVSRCLRTDASV